MLKDAVGGAQTWGFHVSQRLYYLEKKKVT